MSARSRPRPPSRPPTAPPPADTRSFVVLAAWGIAVLALVWASHNPLVASAVGAVAIAVVLVGRYAVSSLSAPVEWRLSLRIPVLDCRVDVAFAHPHRGR